MYLSFLRHFNYIFMLFLAWHCVSLFPREDTVKEHFILMSEFGFRFETAGKSPETAESRTRKFSLPHQSEFYFMCMVIRINAFSIHFSTLIHITYAWKSQMQYEQLLVCSALLSFMLWVFCLNIHTSFFTLGEFWESLRRLSCCSTRRQRMKTWRNFKTFSWSFPGVCQVFKLI